MIVLSWPPNKPVAKSRMLSSFPSLKHVLLTVVTQFLEGQILALRRKVRPISFGIMLLFDVANALLLLNQWQITLVQREVGCELKDFADYAWDLVLSHFQ